MTMEVVQGIDEGGMEAAMQEKPEGHKISELEALYRDADDFDKELFAEQRSNILLVAGEHYSKLRSNFYRRLRDARSISNEQKIRLTKNHIQKITDSYVNHIVSTAPGVGFEPANQSELQDQKAAEMNKAVWEMAKSKHGLDEVIQEWAGDFVEIGEVGVKVFWDPMAGENQTGGFQFEEFYGFNFLVDPSATSFKKAAWCCIRKMVNVKELKAMFPGEDNAKFIQEGSNETFTIFDRGRGGYQKSKDQCLVREFYFRPCAQYPSGYYYITVKDKILYEDSFPGGKFPIVFKPFRRLQTKARGQSIVKVLRPYQMEINRASSKIAEHQITLGDDKLLIQHGTKVTAGASLPGVRSVNYTGAAPTVLQGRDGSQYLNYAVAQISEMYSAANVSEKDEDAVAGQNDAYAMLFRSASQKKKFQIYIKKFEQFLVEVCELYLDLARYHLPDDAVVQMVGRKEQVNIPEFRSTGPLCYKIKISAQASDLETKFGNQLSLNHLLQYVGPQLGKEDIGKLIRAMPYCNLEESFNDLTIDYDSAKNDILALDRGETPPVHPNDPHQYMIKKLTARMRQPDFDYTAPEIQFNYAERIKAHEQFVAEQVKAEQAAKAGFIPTGGYMVTCDFYIQTDPKDPSKVRRVRMPSEALQWLLDKLDGQGATLDSLEGMNKQNLAEIARMVTGGNEMPPQMGEAMPEGETNGVGAAVDVG